VFVLEDPKGIIAEISSLRVQKRSWLVIIGKKSSGNLVGNHVRNLVRNLEEIPTTSLC